MEDITTENQPSLRRSLRISKSNPKYMQAHLLCRRCVTFTVLCVRDRERKHSVMLAWAWNVEFHSCGAGAVQTEGRGTV